MKDVVHMRAIQPNLCNIFLSCILFVMNFQNWIMDKYKTESSSFFAGARVHHGRRCARTKTLLGEGEEEQGKGGGGGSPARQGRPTMLAGRCAHGGSRSSCVGSSRRKRTSAAQRGSGWVPVRALDCGDTHGSGRRCWWERGQALGRPLVREARWRLRRE
jgi:hypothetical protein